MNKVSIVIPCFNNYDTIIDTFNSVLNQSFRNYEIIIINDGSDEEEGYDEEDDDDDEHNDGNGLRVVDDIIPDFFIYLFTYVSYSFLISLSLRIRFLQRLQR